MRRASPIHSVIYIPGLGDSRVGGQRLAVRQWRLHGLEPYLFQMNWHNDEPFEVKLNRLLRLVDRLHQQGRRISLVGASAGASVVIAAFARRRDIISSAACLCGKLRNPHTVSERVYERNPAFRTAMEALPSNLAALTPEDRGRILSVKPLADESVPPEDTRIEGAHSATLRVAGHVGSIAYGLTLGSWRMLRFLKRTGRAS